jgi:hypothetical protein
MTGVIGYARTFFHGGAFEPPRLSSLSEEIGRFHATLAAIQRDFADDSLQATISDEQFLQGPLSDAMTHAGQLAILRRIFGDPVPPENFIYAGISPQNVSPDQPAPAAPDPGWTPDQPPRPPGRPR